LLVGVRHLLSLVELFLRWPTKGWSVKICGRAISSQVSLTLLSLLDHTLRVSADVCSPSSYFIVEAQRLVVGGVGKRIRDSVLYPPTDISQARKHNMRYCNGRSWHLVHALHRVCTSRNNPHTPNSDFFAATALLRFAMVVIHYSLSTHLGLQRFPCSCR
jgi:hypothetical protein